MKTIHKRFLMVLFRNVHINTVFLPALIGAQVFIKNTRQKNEVFVSVFLNSKQSLSLMSYAYRRNSFKV